MEDQSAAEAAVSTSVQPVSESIRDAVIRSLKEWRTAKQRNLFLTIMPAASPSGVILLDGVDLSGLDFSPVQYWVTIETEDGPRRVLRTLRLTINQFTHLTRVNLTDTNMTSADCIRTRFHGSRLINTNFCGTSWLRVDATNTVLSGCQLSRSELRKSDFSGSKAASDNSPSFNECKAWNCLFVSASLRFMKASRAQFVACDFKGADLSGGNFEYTNCKGCDFRGARVDGMQLSHGNFCNSDWRGVDLSNAVGFDWQNFKGAKMDGAILPPLAGEPSTVSGCCHWSFFASPVVPWLGKDHSLVLVKPEGDLFAISQALAEYGQSIIAMMTVFPSRHQITRLYHSIKACYFFDALRAYLTGRKATALVVQGDPDQLMACKLAVRKKYAESLGEAPLEALAMQGKRLHMIEHQRVYQHQYRSTFDVMHASDPGKGPDEVAQFFRVTDLMATPIGGDERVRIVLSLLRHPARLIDEAPPVAVRTTRAEHELRLLIVKPDGMPFISTVLQLMHDNQLSPMAIKFMRVKKTQVQKLYAQYKDRYFYEALVQYVAGRSLVVMAVQGNDAAFLAYRQALRAALGDEILRPSEQVLREYQAGHPEEPVHDVKIDRFREEYAKTFESIHCSYAGHGDEELKLFFQDQALTPRPPMGAEEKWAIMTRLLASRAASRQADVVEHPSLAFREETVLPSAAAHVI